MFTSWLLSGNRLRQGVGLIQRHLGLGLAAVVAKAVWGNAPARAATLDFSALNGVFPVFGEVLNYYDGGFGSFGSGAGPDDGVGFAWVPIECGPKHSFEAACHSSYISSPRRFRHTLDVLQSRHSATEKPQCLIQF